MRKRLCLVLVLLFGSAFAFTSNPAEARARHDQMVGTYQSVKKQVQTKKYRVTKSSVGQKKIRHTAKKRPAKGSGASLAGVTPVLAAKARQIVVNCGSTIVSAVSRRGIRSNHPIGRAVDIKGNPGC